jgi:hypothetical protein
VQTVFAYRDNGWMSAVTRWKPRRVYCSNELNPTEGSGVEEYVVKFRQGKPGTAAVISEVVGGQLLRAGDMPVLEARLVSASKAFARSCKAKSEIPYPVQPGLHFGTVWRADLQAGPPQRIEQLADPQELVNLWAFDSWLCTTDREVYGNILLQHRGGDRYALIAADQSDCFGGAGAFADGTWKKQLEKPNAAASLDFLDRAIMDLGGAAALRHAIAKVDAAAKQLRTVIALVPPEWWKEAGIDPDEVKNALERRHRKLDSILDLKKWEGLGHATRGGRLL